MFTSKWVFRAIFSLTAMIVMWMGAQFFTKFVIHKKFSYYAKGEAIHWGVLSRAPDTHNLYVDYYYSFRGETYTAQYIFKKPLFKSREAAEMALEGKKSSSVDVWFFPKEHPVSILENEFPYNDLIRFVLATAILVYFCFLRSYMKQFSRLETSPS
jgi:hypothetical protein